MRINDVITQSECSPFDGIFSQPLLQLMLRDNKENLFFDIGLRCNGNPRKCIDSREPFKAWYQITNSPFVFPYIS